MKLEEYFKIKDFLKITLINDIFVLLSVEDGQLIIELSRDENFFEKVNLENISDIIWNIDFNTKIEDIKDIIIQVILNRYITEHM